MRKFLLFSLACLLIFFGGGSANSNEDGRFFLKARAADYEKLLGDIENGPLRESLKKTLEETTMTDCTKPKFINVYDEKLRAFFQFLEKHYADRSDVSSLNNSAIARYLQFKKDLEQIFLNLRNAKVRETINENFGSVYLPDIYRNILDNYTACEQIMLTYARLARENLTKRARTANAEKKATKFLQKQQAINDKLSTLNYRLLETLGLYQTFKNKLPGFVPNSCYQQ